MAVLLHVISTLDSSAAVRQLFDVVRHLPAPEFTNRLIVLQRGGALGPEFQAAGIEIEYLNAHRGYDLSAWLRLRRRLREMAPAAVTAWDSQSNQYVLSAADARQHLIAHVSDVAREQATLSRLVRWRYGEHVLEWIVPSVAVRQACVAAGWPGPKLNVIPPGVTPCEPSGTKAALCQALGIPTGAHLIGMAGALTRRKRHKDAIWAADMLKFYRPDIFVLIAGSGSHEWRLRRFRRQCVVQDRVLLLGERSDWPSILPHCDVFWETDERPASSRAVLEALAARVPVVATNVGGHRELIDDRQAGWLVRVGNRAAFANAGNRLIDDRPLANQIATAAQARVESDFSTAKMVARYAELYRTVIAMS